MLLSNSRSYCECGTSVTYFLVKDVSLADSRILGHSSIIITSDFGRNATIKIFLVCCLNLDFNFVLSKEFDRFKYLVPLSWLETDDSLRTKQGS